MKRILYICLMFSVSLQSKAQLILSDSLVQAYHHAPNDSVRYVLNGKILSYYFKTNLDSALKYAETGLMIAKKNGMKLAEAVYSSLLADQLTNKGKYAESLKYFLLAFAIAEDPGIEKRNDWKLIKDKPIHYQRLNVLSSIHHNYRILMERIKNREQELFHAKESKRIAQENNDQYRMMTADDELGRIYIKLNQLDSADRLIKNAGKIAQERDDKIFRCYILSDIGFVNLKMGNKDTALRYYHAGIDLALKQNFLSGLTFGYLRLCKFYLAEREKDSALHFAKLFQQSYNSQGRVDREGQDIGVVYENLRASYVLRDQQDSALKYSGLAILAKDSIAKDRLENLAAFQNISLGEQMRIQKIDKEKKDYQNKIRTYILIGGLALILFVALILYRNNRQKHKVNTVLAKTLSDLESTQTQLIQSEKMASLGELTAGIAHEIQNPLNFVNNFSEVSNELIAEMNIELDKGEIEEAKSIAADIKQNLEKINAFYAVDERLRQAQPDKADVTLSLSKGLSQSKGYEPTVSISTKKVGDKVLISVSDNGNGIPQKVLDKIFQPFFTTKPTGRGTGLGLSLSYDIVTKGHGGELKVETKEGEGATFIIQIPT